MRSGETARREEVVSKKMKIKVQVRRKVRQPSARQGCNRSV